MQVSLTPMLLWCGRNPEWVTTSRHLPWATFRLDTFGLDGTTLVFQAGPLRQYENSPYAESNDAVHAGSAQTLAYIYQLS